MCLGRPGVVTKVWEEGGVPMALVDSGASTETACLLATPDLKEGTSVLVHLGFVVQVLDPGLAKEATLLRSELAGQGSPPAHDEEDGEP